MNEDPLARAFLQVSTKAWRLAHALTFRAADAEDLLQQSLLVAARKRRRIPLDDPWPWFAAVMHREVLNQRRKRARQAAASLEEAFMAHSDAPGPDQQAARAETLRQLHDAMRELPVAERDALVAGYIGGLTQEQAANALGLPLGTYKKRVRDGLAGLRKKMNVEAAALLPLLPFPLPRAGWEAVMLNTANALAPGGAVLGGIAMKKALVAAAMVVASLLAIWGGYTVYTSPPAEDVDHGSPVQVGKSGTRHEDASPNQSSVKEGRDTHGAGVLTPRVRPDPETGESRPSSNSAEPETPKPVTPVEPAAQCSARVSGRVVASAGTGIEGATVAGFAQTATCGGAGDFALELSWSGRPDTMVSLTASAQGFATVASREIAVRDGGEVSGVTLVLHKSASVFGKVVWEGSGDPGIGVEVDCTHGDRTGKEGNIDFAKSGRVAIAGPDGGFEISGLVPGAWILRAQNPRSTANVVEGGSLPTPRHAATEFFRLTEGQRAGPFTLELPRQMRLLFKLAPPAGGTVGVQLVSGGENNRMGMDSLPSTGGWGVRLAPNEAGVYIADWLTTRHTQLRVKADGFAETRFPFKPRLGEDLDLGELTLERGRTVTGRVEDASGRGIEGATVFIQADIDLPFVSPDGSDPRHHHADATSDADGRFALEAISGGAYVLTASHAAYSTTTIKVAVRKDIDPAPLRVVMHAAGTVFGSVAKPAGRGSGTWRDGVRAISMRDARVVELVSLTAGYAAFLGMKGQAATTLDEAGNYELTGLAPGPWMVVGYREGHADFRMNIEVAAGGRERVDFDFALRTGGIGGVFTRGGKPFAGAELFVVGARAVDRATPKAKPAEDGSFEFKDILPGSWFVLTLDEAKLMNPALLGRRKVQVEPGKIARLQVELEAEGPALQGTVKLGGLPFYTSVRLVPGFGGASERQAAIDKEGGFAVSGLAPGTWHAWFRGGTQFSMGLAYAAIEVADEPVPFTRDFARATLTVKCALETIPPALRVNARLQGGGPPGEAGVLMLPLDAGGTSTFANFTPGRWRFTLEAPGFPPVVRDIELADATEVDLTPTGKAAGLTVTFEGAQGFEAEDLKAWLYGRAWVVQGEFATSRRMVAVRENYVAKVQFESLAEGAATLHFEGDNFEPVTLELALQAGKTEAITINPHKAARVTFKAAVVLAPTPVTVKDAAGRTVDVSATLLNDARALAAGKLQVGPLAAGTYSITLTLEGDKTVTVQAAVARGQQVEVAWPVE